MPASLTASEEFTLTVQGPATGDPRTSAGVRGLVQPVLNRTLWNWRRMQDLLGSFCPVGATAPTAIQSIDTSTDRITLEGHGLTSNDPVRVYLGTGAVIPSGLSESTLYYTRYIDADTVELSTASGPGSAVNITGGGSGAIYLVKVTDALAKIMVPLSAGIGGKTLRATLGDFGLLAMDNTWEGEHVYNGGVQFNDSVSVANGATASVANGGTLSLVAGSHLTWGNPASHTLTTPSITIDATAAFLHDFTGSPGGNVVIYLQQVTAPIPKTNVMKRIRYSISGAYSVSVRREGSAGNICEFTGTSHSGEIWVWFDGTNWRGGLYCSSGTATPGADWV